MDVLPFLVLAHIVLDQIVELHRDCEDQLVEGW